MPTYTLNKKSLYTSLQLPPHSVMHRRHVSSLLLLSLCLSSLSTVLGSIVANHGLVGLTMRLRTLSSSEVMHARYDHSIWTHGDLPDSFFVRSSIFRINQGLSGYATISFEAVSKQGFYLSMRSMRMHLKPIERTSKFRKTSSFIVHTGLAGRGGVSFESVLRSGWYLSRVSYLFFFIPINSY